MTNMLTIVADPVEKIPIELVGVKYEVTPPKAALALRMAVEAKIGTASGNPDMVIEALRVWVVKAFGPVEGELVMARLDAADDLLDIPHLMKLMDLLVERTTGNPPT